MLSSRPLYANDSDAQWYSETAAAHRFEEFISAGRNTLLVGERGSGKTTLLHMAELRLRRDRRRVAFASFASVEHVGQAVVALAQAATENHLIEPPDEELLRTSNRLEDPFSPNMVVRLLGDVGDAVLLVDDVPGAVGHALFGRLRDELWQLEDLTWGVGASTEDMSQLILPPADAFFDKRVPLDPMERAERLDLLKRRASRGRDALSEKDLDRVAIEGPGNPRRLIGLARQVAEGGSAVTDLAKGAEARRGRAEAVAGRPAAMLVAEMETLGPVSASDARLLDRLGWTRPRAAGLLTGLEKHGIVTSYTEQRDGPGRPRKLYELRPAEEFAGGT